MAIADDFTIDYINKRIVMNTAFVESSHTAYAVNEVYSWLQDVFDELTQMDDPIPMSAQTPNAYTLVNGWFIDDETMKWFDDGAIATTGWDAGTYADGVRILKLDGTAGLTAADIGTVVSGTTTGDTGKLLAYDTSLNYLWVRTDTLGDAFDNTTETINVDDVLCGDMNGVASVTGETLWTNIYTLGTIVAGVDIYVIQDQSKITSWWSSGHVDVLIKVREAGTLIDSGNITVFARQNPSGGNASLYDNFALDLSAGGRQAVPLATALDLNNTNSHATILGWFDGDPYATPTIGFSNPYNEDLNNGAGSKEYNVSIDCQGAPLDYIYEYLKYVTREGSTTQLQEQGTDTLDGEQYTVASGTFAPVKAAPFGTFAGGSFFGARGVWIHSYHIDDAKNFQLIANDGTTQSPPNTVTVQVTSVEIGDRVGVFVLTEAAGEIEKDTYTSAADPTNNTDDFDFVVQEAIAADTPSSGQFRVVQSGTGAEEIYRYASWATSTFTLESEITGTCDSGGDGTTLLDAGTNFSGINIVVGDTIHNITDGGRASVVTVASGQLTTTQLIDGSLNTWASSDIYAVHSLSRMYYGGDTVYVPIVDFQATSTTAANTLIQSTTIPVLVRVRKKGIIPFEVESSVGATGMSVAAIRTTDGIVTL